MFCALATGFLDVKPSENRLCCGEAIAAIIGCEGFSLQIRLISKHDQKPPIRMTDRATITHVDRGRVKLILAGDQAAFRELFDDFFPRLFRFALARLNGDREAAADVVQQTFCKAIAGLDGYRGEASLYTWFCQICRNATVDYCRSMNRHAEQVVLYEDHTNVQAILEALTAPVNEQPETGAWRRDIRRLIQATVDALPPHYGDILEWKYIDNRSVIEIADRLGSSAKAAESMLTRARTAFREAITEMAGETDALRPPS